ncbi:MAG: thymidine phosphorylase [Defluviicoccus sp.]|nr:thymidine phosphorylase [Defluviicoccus sp.]MDE0383980.1 thymidine phosphorylase [Defluviicoccus sp.]
MLRLARLAIDSWREPVAFLNRGCTEYAAESFLGPRKVEVSDGRRSVTCVLNLVDDAALVARDALALSAHAFALLGLEEGAPVAIRRAPEPASRAALRARIAGRRLSEAEIDAVVEDMVAGRYAGRETAGFLVAAAQTLDDGEVIAFARARAERSAQIVWPDGMVVDKHSMGGIPGTRVTMVVVPIVIAHGLTIPKAASRAITSPAGTADTMEVLARVDLDAEEVCRVVAEVGGCIVWNGRLSHSPIDDVMNAVTRPLGIVSDRLSVSSILSKKAALGVTHIVFDIPVGPTAKVATRADADALARLFAVTAEGLGIAARCEITDGTQPIGSGIGPALEARDVAQVLAGDPDAPADLRDKSLMLAARVLAFAGVAEPRERAEALLASGAAARAMERLVDAQGRNPDPPGPGRLTREVAAGSSGTVAAIDCHRIAGIARRAGAPLEKSAGIDQFRQRGDRVEQGEPLYRIHAEEEADLAEAAAYAEQGSGFEVAAG